MNFKRWLILIVVLLGLATLYYSSGYFFVYNNNAYVSADVVRVASGASGIVEEVTVNDNDFVKDGELLVSLQQQPFLLAVQLAQAQLDKALAEQKNLSAATAEALAEINISKAKEKLASANFKRYQKLFKSGNVSQQNFQVAEEQYKISQLELVEAKQAYQLSLQQKDVYAAEIKKYESILGQAQYQLKISKIYAPSDGFINNLKIFPGDYATLGETLFGFVKQSTSRVVANVRDTDLLMLKKGKPVWVYLSSYPWQLFRGEVESVGRGVSRSDSVENPALPYVEPVTSWIRYSYRIPVRINLINFPEDKNLYVGVDARVFIFR